MDRINLQIKQYSQKSYEKRIHFSYTQSSLIAYDTFKKYKTRYENIIERNKMEKNEMVGILEKIKQKTVLANFSNLKKEKLETKIINCLHFDTLLNVSAYFKTIIQPQPNTIAFKGNNFNRMVCGSNNIYHDKPHSAYMIQYLSKGIVPNKGNSILLTDKLPPAAESLAPHVEITELPHPHPLPPTTQSTEHSLNTENLVNAESSGTAQNELEKMQSLCPNQHSFLGCLETNSSVPNLLQPNQQKLSVSIEKLSKPLSSVETPAKQRPKNVERSKRRKELNFCCRLSNESCEPFERYHVGNIEVIKMKAVHTSNPFLFSLIFSLDTLYLNWMKTESDFKEYEANIKQFEQYLTCYIYKNVSKQKQKKYLASLKYFETFGSASTQGLAKQCITEKIRSGSGLDSVRGTEQRSLTCGLVCEIICEIFSVNIIIVSHKELQNISSDGSENMNHYHQEEYTLEETIEFYPLQSKFAISRKTIFIIDNCPTYLTTSNLLVPSFWNNFFRHYLEINSKLSNLRELLPIFDIECVVDMKNRKNVMLDIVLPTIDSLFPTT